MRTQLIITGPKEHIEVYRKLALFDKDVTVYKSQKEFSGTKPDKLELFRQSGLENFKDYWESEEDGIWDKFYKK